MPLYGHTSLAGQARADCLSYCAWALAAPGVQSGTDESFTGKLRDDCLSVEWFRSRREAKIIIEAWRQPHNLVRPHSSLE